VSEPETRDAVALRGGTPAPLHRLARGIIWWLDPDSNPGAVVYGIITVGAVIAAESARPADPTREIVATTVVLLVYWMAHSYATVQGERFAKREPLSSKVVVSTVATEAAIVRGASLPIIAMIIAELAGASASTIGYVGMIASIGVLVFFELITGLRSQLGPWALVLQGLVGVSFGLAIVAVRSLLA